MNCENAILFTTVYPCLLCAKIIVECGISKVIYDKDYNSELTKKFLKVLVFNLLNGMQDLISFYR